MGDSSLLRKSEHVSVAAESLYRGEATTDQTMTIAPAKKTSVIEANRRHEKDVGSPEIQVAIITERISALTGHFRANKKDHASRRGLLLMVGRRNRLLKYLAASDRERYQDLIKKLGLRK